LKGENFYRSAKKIKTLNMFKDGGATRDKNGKIIKAASYQSRDVPKAVIEPNRRWFTNTRVIAQDTLKSFREAIAEKDKDPYSVLLKSNKLPMSLIRDGPQDAMKKHEAKMTIESEPFSDTFGPKAQRKRPKVSFNSIDDLAANTEKSLETYHARVEEIKFLNGQSGSSAAPELADGYVEEEDFSVSLAKEAIFSKGQSKRIWNELCMPSVIPLYGQDLTFIQTRSLTLPMSSFTFLTLVTPLAPDVATSKSIWLLRRHTNILFSS
jgi:nuclear GTP-binding protein